MCMNQVDIVQDLFGQRCDRVRYEPRGCSRTYVWNVKLVVETGVYRMWGGLAHTWCTFLMNISFKFSAVTYVGRQSINTSTVTD